ncbi:Uncharacterized protein PBTT_03612 [Plasmodiophora brassicae]|uniref:Uncharacterized protein n=1 Tax=Plasmodiophora brassicae TaxID=37360 RepID=A0A0G4IJV6_PLABS|nr:hypothetical protein PBRA_004131 [Plasmodiophora brassicae]SPQ96183.1 unnamed protein product [Plasmodiophora brassicae]
MSRSGCRPSIPHFHPKCKICYGSLAEFVRASSLGSDASRRRNRPPEDDEGSSRAQRNESGPKLYRIRFKTFVKAYCNAHARPSSSVGMTEINADSLQEFLHALLDVCRRHVVGIAVRDGLDEPASFVLRPAPIEAEDLPGLIRFKASNHVYNVGEDGDLSEKTLTRWTHNATKPDLYIYKYGNNIVNVSEFKRFQTTVLGVPQVDRAGHPSNEAVASVVAQLKDRWGHIYVSDPINWQIWASEISRLSAPQQAACSQSRANIPMTLSSIPSTASAMPSQWS